MNEISKSLERREVQIAARRYRRKGYKVRQASDPSQLPSFLGDLVPDLIAERDDDRVIIGVKQTTAVRGSNEIVELAERVSSEPGWRFELIAVPASSRIERPDFSAGARSAELLIDHEFTAPAYVYIFAMIESLLSYAMARADKNPADYSFSALIREAVTQGFIDGSMVQVLESVQACRNAIAHGGQPMTPTREEVLSLLSIAFNLDREISAVN